MRSEKGFTLIEVMIIIAIVAVIAAAVYNAYFGSLEVWNFNKSRLEVQRTQDLTYSWISRYARQATKIDPDYNNSTLTDDQDILYLEYDENGITKRVAFGRSKNQTDYLYFFNINTGDKKKISDLKFKTLDFYYFEKDAPEGRFNNLIEVEAEFLNQNEDATYHFSSRFDPRLAEITTP